MRHGTLLVHLHVPVRLFRACLLTVCHARHCCEPEVYFNAPAQNNIRFTEFPRTTPPPSTPALTAPHSFFHQLQCRRSSDSDTRTPCIFNTHFPTAKRTQRQTLIVSRKMLAKQLLPAAVAMSAATLAQGRGLNERAICEYQALMAV